MALAILSAVFLGFSRSFFLRPLFPGHRAPPEAFFNLHGAVFTAWYVLLVVRPSSSAWGGPTCTGGSGSPVRCWRWRWWSRERRGRSWRRDPETHKRFMLVASITIITAAVARWPFAFMKAGPPVFLGVTDLFLVPLVIWNLATRRRLHPATLWAGLAVLASQPFRLWVSGTAAWLAFARWRRASGADRREAARGEGDRTGAGSGGRARRSLPGQV